MNTSIHKCSLCTRDQVSTMYTASSTICKKCTFIKNRIPVDISRVYSLSQIKQRYTAKISQAIKKKVVPNYICTLDDYLDLLESNKCHFCRDYIAKRFRTVILKQPYSKGGMFDKDNLAMACLFCASTKLNRTELDYKKMLGTDRLE